MRLYDLHHPDIPLTNHSMSTSKTPWVDAVGTNGGFYRNAENGWYIPIDFARRLEELVHQQHEALDGHGTMAIEYSDWQERARKAEQAYEELKKELES